MTDVETPARRWFVLVWTAVGIALLLIGLYRLLAEPLHIVVPPLVLAIVIVYLLDPVVSWLERGHVPRVLGAVIAYALVGGVLTGIGVLVLPIVADQVGALGDQLPDIAARLETFINERLPESIERVDLTPDLSEEETGSALSRFFTDNTEGVVGLLRAAGAVLVLVVESVITLVAAPFLAFYLLVDRPRLGEGIARLVPPDSRAEWVDVSRRVGRTVGAYFRGQILVALFVGVATAIGLAVIGLPFWAIVGGAAGVFNLVPFIGPFVGGLLGVVVAVTAGDGLGQAVAVVIVMTVVQQVDNHLLTPQILSRTVKLHPVTIIVILASAASLFGILGMLVVIPVFAAVKLVILYVLVTRVPSMRHLAGDGPEVIDGVPAAELGATSLVGLGRDLRRMWEARRTGS